MKKLLSMLIAASFATVSLGALAAAHGGAMSDADKAKKMEACNKMDAKTADDKMKAECKTMSDADKAQKMEACKKMDAKADDKMKAECKKMMAEKKPTDAAKPAEAPKK